jgi:outer membrane protein OmpA-like peptidoglycan-associated protein
MRALVAAGLVVAMLPGCAALNKPWGRGATTGALAGAAIGGAAGAGEEYGRGFHSPEQIGRGAAVGVGVGLIVGALVGHLIGDQAAAPAEAAPPPPAPPPAAVAKAPAEPVEKTIVLQSDGKGQEVLFPFAEASIPESYLPALDRAAAEIKENASLRVLVEGHTDNVGSDHFNMELGLRRAHAVRQYLISQGIEGTRLEEVSYGESQPIAPNTTEEGRTKNRRVVLRIGNGHSH